MQLVNGNPASVGLAGEIGTLAKNTATGIIYTKTSTGNTDWTKTTKTLASSLQDSLLSDALDLTGMDVEDAGVFFDDFINTIQWNTGLTEVSTAGAVVSRAASAIVKALGPYWVAPTGKWYISWRGAISGVAGGSICEVGSINASSQSVNCGMRAATSATKYSAFVGGASPITLTSTVSYSSGSTRLFKFWNDGTNVSFSVDSETAVTSASSGITTASNLVPQVFVDTAGTVLADWLIVVGERAGSL